MAFAVVATAKNVGSANPNCLKFKGIMKSFLKRIESLGIHKRMTQ